MEYDTISPHPRHHHLTFRKNQHGVNYNKIMPEPLLELKRTKYLTIIHTLFFRVLFSRTHTGSRPVLCKYLTLHFEYAIKIKVEEGGTKSDIVCQWFIMGPSCLINILFVFRASIFNDEVVALNAYPFLNAMGKPIPSLKIVWDWLRIKFDPCTIHNRHWYRLILTTDIKIILNVDFAQNDKKLLMSLLREKQKEEKKWFLFWI